MALSFLYTQLQDELYECRPNKKVGISISSNPALSGCRRGQGEVIRAAIAEAETP